MEASFAEMETETETAPATEEVESTEFPEHAEVMNQFITLSEAGEASTTEGEFDAIMAEFGMIADSALHLESGITDFDTAWFNYMWTTSDLSMAWAEGDMEYASAAMDNLEMLGDTLIEEAPAGLDLAYRMIRLRAPAFGSGVFASPAPGRSFRPRTQRPAVIWRFAARDPH